MTGVIRYMGGRQRVSVVLEIGGEGRTGGLHRRPHHQGCVVRRRRRVMNGLAGNVTVARRASLLWLGALIAAAVMLSLSAFSPGARAARSQPTTTIVLVHGAFASPAGWG